MKWYHWSVEYFEDLRNVNHCEIIVMKQNPDNGKYLLENELRTWSDLKRRAAASEQAKPTKESSTPLPTRKWGGCVDGCDHSKFNLPHRPKRQSSLNEKGDNSLASQEAENSTTLRRKNLSSKSLASTVSLTTMREDATQKDEGALLTPSSSAANEETDAVDVRQPESDGVYSEESDLEHEDSSPFSGSPRKEHAAHHLHHSRRHMNLPHTAGRGLFGSAPGDISDEADESDYFDTNIHQMQKRMSHSEPTRSALSQEAAGAPSPSQSRGGSLARTGSKGKLVRKNSASRMEKQWQKDSGMTNHKRADALGDVDEDDDLQETEEKVEELKEADRKSLSEIY